MRFELTILGTSAAIPTSDRNTSAQIVNHNEQLFLIDCGEATQIQLRKFHFSFNKISHIFISHLHGDHYLGLIGLLFSFHLLGRTKEINVYAHEQLKDIINIQLEASKTNLLYPLNFHIIDDNESVLMQNDNIVVESINMNHSIPTAGFLFREKKKTRNINKDFLKKENVSVNEIIEIKNGNDFVNEDGLFFSNTSITSNPSHQRSFAHCSDTIYNESILKNIEGVDLLYHEATFTRDLSEIAKKKFHSTANQAGNIAKRANVDKLIIGHYSARYSDVTPLLDEAANVFKNVFIAEEGKVFSI